MSSRSTLMSGADGQTTFLIHDRGAPLSAGYATMGFWIGKTPLVVEDMEA